MQQSAGRIKISTASSPCLGNNLRGAAQDHGNGGHSPPRWAYIDDNPNYKPPVDDGNLVHVPNSTAGYTWTQLRPHSSRQSGTRTIMGHCRTS